MTAYGGMISAANPTSLRCTFGTFEELEADNEARLIQTVRGVGYVMREE